MENSIPALGKDDDFVAVVLDELPTPALPAHGLVPHRLALVDGLWFDAIMGIGFTTSGLSRLGLVVHRSRGSLLLSFPIRRAQRLSPLSEAPV